MTNLNELTTIQAAALIGKGELTSEALTQACLDHIAAREDAVRAFAYIDPEHALAQARAADLHKRSGQPTGPLHGVPVGIKDIIDTKDMPTQCGTPAFKDRRPEEDATVVAALRAAGAIIIGKTVTTELALSSPNKTRHPRNPARTPGGSSSGSAAAVADNMIPAALGTQTAGSVIRPGSFCGIYAMKPTYGLIPRPGVLDQSFSLDTIGLYSRAIEDLALLVDVLAVHDNRDSASLSVSRGNYLAAATAEWKLKPMMAFIKTSAWNEFAEPATKEAFGELVEMLGDQVEEISLDETTAKGLAAQRTLQLSELATQFGPIADRTPTLLSKIMLDSIEQGRRINATTYLEAKAFRNIAYRALTEMFINYGSILTAASAGPAPAIDTTGNPIFNAFWTYVGTPCITLPLLEVDGMPLGVQLVGARHDDARLLRTARLFERQLAEMA